MEIKDIELIHPPKEAIDFFRNFIKEHDKGLKAIKTLAEIKEVAEEYIEIYFPDYYDEGTENDVVTEFANKILQKINEVEDES